MTKTFSHFEFVMTAVNWRVPVYTDGTMGRPEMTSSWNKPVLGTPKYKKKQSNMDSEEVQTENL